MKSVFLKDALGAQQSFEVNAALVASKSVASKYFGTWYKSNATYADMVAWATAQISAREREIANLQVLKGAAQEEMVEGMSADTLRAILQKMESAV